MTAPKLLPYTSEDHQLAHQFLVEEAHLLDSLRFEAWLALLTEDIEYRMPVRVITEYAWHSLFARNLLIPLKTQDEYQNHVPEFTVIVAPSFHCDPRVDGTRSSTAIILDFSKRLAIICNSSIIP